ncbi:protein ROH1A-like [Musa acuminata AAA Group]|uniref:protein ROH1A-like n=1 Tax=Musa acuminata AAA Group TaxID=214697 RepID=UPI0031D194B0
MTITMPENQGGGSPLSMAFRGRTFLSLRRSQVVSMEQGQEQELDLFQTHVADRLLALLPPSNVGGGGEPPLSLAFLSKLLDALIACEEEFRSLLGQNHASLLSKPPADRAVADLLDRAVKSLDVCNAVSLALRSLRHWHRHALIAASALPSDHCGQGQLNRARRALAKLLASGPDSPSAASGRYDGSSGRSSGSSCSSNHMRALSWSVSRNWSAGRQMPPVPAHLATPRGGEAGGAGMALAVYAMSSVLSFSMWVLAAAVPCQDRGSAAPSSPVSPRQHLPWAAAMAGLQDRITDEWRRRKGLAGLLAEIQGVEQCGKELMEAVGESGPPPSRAEDVAAVAARAAELAEACRRLEEGLGPLERQVREVFHLVIGNRAEVLRCVDHSARTAATTPNPPLLSQ